ncbi:MAG: phosphoribosylanthranilate isomerase [Deltaproteobacteria bacterium]|nr:phosphoribosylanthranilate isomerase [Deltaproteobacteria bacterium]
MKKKQKINEKQNIPQVKVCGLTNQDEAAGCVSLGADAIGCVFFSKSPRNVSLNQAKKIVRALPSHVKTVGVFVNESFEGIMRAVEHCGLHAVQLHGQEPPELPELLHQKGLTIIKALFMEKSPLLSKAADYRAAAYLVECGKGELPGGNAVSWAWEDAMELGEKRPLILAGGLTPENISIAISSALPDAVDVSSGVESSPGRKDLDKVAAFIRSVKKCGMNKTIKKVF